MRIDLQRAQGDKTAIERPCLRCEKPVPTTTHYRLCKTCRKVKLGIGLEALGNTRTYFGGSNVPNSGRRVHPKDMK